MVGLALVVMLAVATLSVVAVVARHTRVLAATSVGYKDSTGENPNALDIGRVIVTNREGGLLMFGIRLVNSGYEARNHSIWVALDTDIDDATGDTKIQGADWTLGYLHSRANLEQWNGTEWVEAPTSASVNSSLIDGSLLILYVNAKEIGNPAAFDFRVGSMALVPPGTYERLALDFAPDWDKPPWRYELKTDLKPTLAVSKLTCTPDPPKAGKLMIARMTVDVFRGDAIEPLGKKAKVVGVANVAGKRIVGKIAASYRWGKIAVTFKVPKATKGKLMRGFVTATLEGITVRRTFAEKVA